MKEQASSTRHLATGASALEKRLRENLCQHDQGQSSGKATPVDLTFRELQVEQG